MRGGSLIAGLAALISTAAFGENLFLYNFNTDKPGSFTPPSALPGGQQFYLSDKNIKLIVLPENTFFKTRGLMIQTYKDVGYDAFGVTTNPVPHNAWKSYLAVIEGIFAPGSASGYDIQFGLSMGASYGLGLFSARNGTLYYQDGKSEKAFGTYQTDKPHSILYLVNNASTPKTYKVTFMQSGNLVSTPSIPLPYAKAPASGSDYLTLSIIFPENKKYATAGYALDSISINGNFPQ